MPFLVFLNSVSMYLTAVDIKSAETASRIRAVATVPIIIPPRMISLIASDKLSKTSYASPKK